MTLLPGTRLGPYEILAPLGAGGMGEVWKAKDTRLDRFVAVKVLPEHLAENAEALARFEREAKAVAALNHPNILGLFDLGLQDGTAFAVMELLEGESLHARLQQGPLPARKVLDLAVQLAKGLAAAHEKGVIHRDLKPDNLWITRDGRLKILDFGLAKQVAAPKSVPQTMIPTGVVNRGPGTEEGVVLGTMGYMSPEQVRGEMVDARSDIFAFGAVLYEMLTGKRAFSGTSSADTMAAILKEEPPDLEGSGRAIPPGLQRVLHHCLEKDPAHRFQDAHDLAFALENLSGQVSGASLAAPFAPQNRKATRFWAGLGAALLLGVAGHSAWWGWRANASRAEPTFTALTSRRGNLLRARFTPDGQSVVYSATWDGQPAELFVARLDGTATRPLGLAKASVQAVNRRGEVLVLLQGERWGAGSRGTLAVQPMDGGRPKELLERVHQADFGPDGTEVAVAYQATEGGPQRLDFPLGRKLLEFDGSRIRSLRVAPGGGQVAFVFYDDVADATALAVVDRKGARRTLFSLPPLEPMSGLVWSPDGQELFFVRQATLQAVDLRGRLRTVRRDSSLVGLLDVSAQGRFLMERYIGRVTTQATRKGRTLDLSFAPGTALEGNLSADGEQALLYGRGLNGDAGQQMAVRRLDGGPPTLLGGSFPLDQSPDGRWVLACPLGQTEHFDLLPVGPGAAREIREPGRSLLDARFLPDGKHFLLFTRKGEGPKEILLASLEGGPSRVLDLDLLGVTPLSPSDGIRILGFDRAHRPVLRPLLGGPEQTVPCTLGDGEFVLAWDGKNRLIVGRRAEPTTVRLDAVDIPSGRRTPWQVVGPADPSGVFRIDAVRISPDLETVALTYMRSLSSDLFLVEGLK